ncbi:MAG: efflux RND transporter periplasmic adaptor subunit [Bacteroidales bacterium]|jgi:HlyD family secretion protein|nr:efflux RND transporter periplasmic adaptor subunit [Bacteroidales bacterium]
MDIQIEKKKGVQKKHIPYIIGGAVLLALIIWAIFGNNAGTMKVQADSMTTASVLQGQFDDFVRTDGRVQPISVVYLSPEEGGIVMDKVVEEGSQVKKGDIIIRLSNSSLDLSILSSEAELAEKQNLLRNTQISMEQDRLNNLNEKLGLNLEVERKHRAWQQQDRLYQEKLNSREEYIQAKEDYELAIKKNELIIQRLEQDSIFRLAQVNQMQDNLDNMERNVLLIRQRKEHLNIISPIDGELGLLDVELGQNISSGQSIGQINDLSDYKVEANIDEHYIDRVQTGLDATFERGEKSYKLRVRKVYPEVREGQFRIDLVFEGERPDKIRSGQTYYINLQLGQSREAVMIPRGTFFQNTGGTWIFVLNEDGTKAYRRNIRISRQNPQYYEVAEGLEPGEQVIVSNYDAYGDNKVLLLK